jgi:hypothetical protein
MADPADYKSLHVNELPRQPGTSSIANIEAGAEGADIARIEKVYR